MRQLSTTTMGEHGEDYFAAAAGWELDRSAATAAAARYAWLTALAATAIAVMATAAVMMLTPLKTTEPFLIRVDSSTGIVDVVPRYTGTGELPEIVTRHLVTQYVVQRERFIPAIAESDYDQIGAFHSAAMNAAWAAAWVRTNADSPLNRYADGTRVLPQVRSVSFLNRTAGKAELVQVRFVTAIQRSQGGAEELRQYLATLQVTFGPPSADVRLRALNPLGFKVLEYRREPEIGPDATTTSTSSAGAAP